MSSANASAPRIEPPSDPATVRQQIVHAGHVLTRLGVLDAFGHVSARHPNKANTFLMTRRVAPGQSTPDDVHEFGLDGEQPGSNRVPAFIERYIHAAIYAARPDVNAVVHSHSPSIVASGLVPDHPCARLAHVRVSRGPSAGVRHSRRRR